MGRPSHAWLALIALALTLQGMVPTAIAQEQIGATSVDLTLPTLPRPVAPGTAQSFNVRVQYQWNNGISPDDTTIRLEVIEEPPWLESSFEPSQYQVPVTGPSGLNNSIVNLTISIAQDAPAFAIGLARYRVVAEENGALQGAESEVDFEVTAGFSGEISVSLPKGDTVAASGGFVTKVPLRIENQGNGPLLLQITVIRQPAESRFTVPQDVLVGVEDGQRVKTVDLEVLVPWKVSEEGPVEVEIAPTHAQRGVPGPVKEVGFQLNGNSAIPVPGPGPWLSLAAVALATLALRRRPG